MRTTIINSTESESYGSQLTAAAEALRSGALVIFPTETVYGVAANAANPAALIRLREVKGRADAQPFTVHVGQRSHARRFLTNPSPLVGRFIRKLWPGPLTLICREPAPQLTQVARACAPEALADLYHENTVGLRCPDHPTAEQLLTEADAPIVASSANRAGQPPPGDLAAALRALDGQVEFAIDGGPTRFNTASTIVEIDGPEWVVRREGAIDERTLRRLARSEILFVCTGNSCRSPLAEYIFRHHLAARLDTPVSQLESRGYVVRSAGTFALPGGVASDGTLNELARRGIDATQHRAQPLTVELIHRAERIYVMSPEHRALVLDRVPAAADRVELLDPAGPIADPFGAAAEAYQRCAAQIERAIDARLEEFVDEDRHW